ncbi:20630_t:CDS:2 [Racocetra persica]|uniref:20630_t:CDS:1 n=1 Tax=Racocetra persica TaxID=160502 RepID=A0ACA9LCG1_9GLOM|nr:20630_t:CDS:2 [Racocetra persica]
MAAQELLKNESKKSSKTTTPELPDLSELIDKLKNDRRFHEVTDEKDEDLLYSDYLKYFHEMFNVTGLCPLFVDHSGYVLLVLDDRDFMFR